MTPGIENKPFDIVLNTDFFKKDDFLINVNNFFIKVDSNPIKTHWIYDILYYLSFGVYDKRGWEYKVKLINNY